MRKALARWLRAAAQRLDPADVVLVPTVPAGVREDAAALVAHADGFAMGTSGEYRRSWVLGKLMKRHPSAPKGALAFAIEVACFARRR